MQHRETGSSGSDDPDRVVIGAPAAGVVEQLSTRVAYATEWIRVREDQVRWPDGSTGVYSVVERDDYSLVMPREVRAGVAGFWLVEQYRYAVGRRAWEFPQGGWPHGAARGTAEELAAAELREETGMRAERIIRLGRLSEAYGYVRQSCDVFLAEGLTPGEPERESTEQDMVHAWFADAAIDELIRSGAIIDSTALAALTLFRMHVEQA